MEKSETAGVRGGGGGGGTHTSREVTFVLVTVVLVAIVCQSPLAVFHCVRYVQVGRRQQRAPR